MQISSKRLNNTGDSIFRFKAENSEPLQLFIASDIHIDSALCDQMLFRRHLDRAKEIGAYIIILGDIIDIMQWKGDKRANKAELLPELLDSRGGYLNKIIERTVEFFMPYKENLLLFTYGNHETYHINKLELDILRIIASELDCLLGGYEGYISILYEDKNSHSMNKRIFYTHGATNSNAPMTMGVLTHKRMDIWVRDADIILTGHLHKTFYYEETVMYLSRNNQRNYKTVLHLQLPTYKKREAFVGYGIQRSMSPPAIGSYLIELIPTISTKNNTNTRFLKTNFIRWT